MIYKVVFNHPALKKHFEEALFKISLAAQDEIMDAVLNLAENPRPHGVLKIKPPVDIYNFVAQYRIRIGQYRVFYDVDDAGKKVSIIALRRRDEKSYK